MYSLTLLVLLSYLQTVIAKSMARTNCKPSQQIQPVQLIRRLFQDDQSHKQNDNLADSRPSNENLFSFTKERPPSGSALEADINGDEKITLSELTNISAALAKINHTVVLANQFNIEDTDQSNDLTFEEFEQLFNSLAGDLLAIKQIGKHNSVSSNSNNNDDSDDDYFTKAIDKLGIQTYYDEENTDEYGLREYTPKSYSIQIRNIEDATRALLAYARNLSIFECVDQNGDDFVTVLETYSYLSKFIKIRNTAEFLSEFIDATNENSNYLDVREDFSAELMRCEEDVRLLSDLNLSDKFKHTRVKLTTVQYMNCLSSLIHNIINKCAIITRKAQATCGKLRMNTISKKIQLGKLPADPDSLIALALHTVPDTYVIAQGIVSRDRNIQQL